MFNQTTHEISVSTSFARLTHTSVSKKKKENKTKQKKKKKKKKKKKHQLEKKKKKKNFFFIFELVGFINQPPFKRKRNALSTRILFLRKRLCWIIKKV